MDTPKFRGPWFADSKLGVKPQLVDMEVAKVVVRCIQSPDKKGRKPMGKNRLTTEQQ